jgi:AraC-like DNA-binding protein
VVYHRGVVRERIAVSTPAEWAAVCSDSFVPLRVRSVEPSFRASLHSVELTDRVSATRVASNSSEVYRSAKVIAQEPRDDLLLSIHGTGAGTVAQDDRVASLTRGCATLYDASRPYTLSFPTVMSEVVLQVPRDSLGLSDNYLRTVTARTLRPSVPLRALTALVSAATSADSPASQVLEGRAMADAAVSLLRAAVAPADSGSALVRDHLALRIAMVGFIEDHLTDPALSAEAVAHHHHVSLRYAQLLFAEAGDTLAGHIRLRRLERARALIDGGMPVTAAGAQVGFVDHGTFTRAFKRTYDVTPSDYSLATRVSTS